MRNFAILNFFSILLFSYGAFATDTPKPTQQRSQEKTQQSQEKLNKKPHMPTQNVQGPPIANLPKLTLQQAIDIAIQNLPQIRAAQEGLHAAEASVKEKRSYYYPDIHFFAEDLEGTNNQASSSYLALPGIPRTGIRGNDSSISNNFIGGLVLSQTLYDFGRTSSQLKASKAGAHAATYGVEISRQDAILGVKQAYFTLLATQRLIDVNKASINKLEKVLEMAEKGYEIGLRPKIDVSTAKTNLIDQQTTLIRTMGQLKNAKAALNHAMGLDSPHSYEVEDILGREEVNESLKELQKTAYMERPDIMETLAKEEEAKSEVDAAKSNNYPLVIGSTSVNSRGSGDPDASNWDAAVILDVPLNWHKVRHQVEKAKAQLAKANQQSEVIRQQIALEVEETYNDMLSTKERISFAQQNLAQANERLQIAEGRYKSGVGNIIEVTDAQAFLANADAGYIQALYDHNRAVAQLERAVGRPLAR